MSVREPLYEAVLEKIKRLVAAGHFWVSDHARYDRMKLRGVRYRDLRPFFANATHIVDGGFSYDKCNDCEDFVYHVRGHLPDGRKMTTVVSFFEYNGQEKVKIITVIPDGC